MRVLVTGALGHIGSKLIRVLPLNLGCDSIAMVDNLSTQRYCSLFDLPEETRYTFIEKEVVAVDWLKNLDNVDAVIHLAALTDAAGTANQSEKVHKNNFEATKIVADACFEKSVPLIFASSTSVYGTQRETVDESSTELYPQSPYAECKLREESYLTSLFDKGLKGSILRFGTIYGTSPGMRFHTAVNKFCWQAVMKQPLTVWETALHQKRPYLSLSDCCRALSWVLERKIFDKQIYNIVSHNFVVQDIIDEIKKNISSVQVNLVSHKIMNQLSYEVLSDKFTGLGFRFVESFSADIAETIHLLKGSNQ